MSYGEFLIQWYNLPWVAAAFGGLLALVLGRRGPWFIGAFAAGIAGLTLNGALHDLGLGPIGPRTPAVAAAAVVFGALAGWGLPRLRRRVLPPVTGVTFNESGLEGRDVIVLSASLKPGDVGRARHRDDAGVVHVVRIVFRPEDAGTLGFGATRALGTFDPDLRAYEIR